METKANYPLIGAFTVAGFVGILLFLMWFAKLNLDRQFAYYDVFFPDVTGLSVSSDVQFAGLSVGRVIQMQIAPEGAGPVRVRIEVTEDTPVRVDSSASLMIQGVTGVSSLAITPGSQSSALLRETTGGDNVPVIPATRSALQTLSDEGPEMISRLNTVAGQLNELLGDENQTRVRSILDNVERSSSNLDRAMADISKATDAIGTAADGISSFGEKLETISTSAETALNKFTETAGNADTALAAASATLDEVKTYVSGDLKELTTKLDGVAGTLQTDLTRLVDRADTTLDNFDSALEVGKTALVSASKAFDGADRVLNTDLGPVITDFRTTLSTLNEAVSGVSGDLPEITSRLRNAADSADQAFGALRGMLDGARAPVQSFTREALPQYTKLASDLRGLVNNIDQLVTTLRRNPAQVITGPRTPEFRR